ncbi:chaperonin 10-like protein [Diaporthe sp. PMI_573]|nr:chaperonin 10-like protein [Diaporthaceae sp. PMI_573]
MKEALVSSGPAVEIVDSSVPAPGPGHVLIKVVVSGSNPKDWKMPEYYGYERINSGDDIAGLVQSVGAGVVEFKPGDRVAAMHQTGSPGGSFAEYALSPADTTFHIPDHISFEEAATIPLAALTAAVLIFRGLGLPGSSDEMNAVKDDVPFVVYGGASAVGAFAIQLAKHRGIHPIISVAGRGIAFVESLLDRHKGDTVVDYREGDEAVVAGIRAALKGAKLQYALDAVRSDRSHINLANVLASGSSGVTKSKLALVLPLPGNSEVAAGAESGLVRPFDMPLGIEPIFLGVNLVHNQECDRDREFGFIHSRLLARGLKDGWLKPHPHEVQPGGLNGLENALKKLKEGQASATKYVFRLADTPDI